MFFGSDHGGERGALLYGQIGTCRLNDIDPEGEYYPLVHALGGQVVHISPTSKDYINPMDINMDYSDDDNPLGVKSDFVLSLCELIMGSRDGIVNQLKKENKLTKN